MKKKTCKQCKKTFIAVRKSQKFCSKLCGSNKRNKHLTSYKSRLGLLREKNSLKNSVLYENQQKELKQYQFIGISQLAEYLGIGDQDTEFLKSFPHKEYKIIKKRSDSTFFIPSKPTHVFKKVNIDAYFKHKGMEKPKDREIIFTNYKEPLQKIEDGYGYLGTVGQTKDGEYIQCHICGKLFKNLSGHVSQSHKIKVKEYKEKFQLNQTTALASERQRWEYKRKTIEFLSTLTDEEKEEWKRKAIEAKKNMPKKHRIQPKKQLEAYNKNGTCPDQILDKIIQIKKKIGKTPSKNEFIRECGTQQFLHRIITVYGSWAKAIDMLGLKNTNKKSRVGIKNKQYTNEELLEYLRIFAEENNQIPTHTDFINGYFPDENIYSKRFGGIEKARQLAGVYDVVDQDVIDQFKNKPKKIKNHYGKPQFTL